MFVVAVRDEEGRSSKKSFRELTDEELLPFLKKGDEEAFREIVSRYQHRLYNFALRFTRNPEDAEEIVQETFLKVFHSLKGFRGDSLFSTWIYQITKNLCINYHYTRLRHHDATTYSLDTTQGEVGEEEEGEEQSHTFQIPVTEPSPQELLLRKEFHEILESAVRELDPHYRIALILRDVEGMEYEEIARILKVPVGTVKSRIHRARWILMEKIKPFLEGGI